MAGELATIGAKFAYAVETTAGTKPTAFTQILGAKTLPEASTQRSQIDVTPLDETERHRNIPGLMEALDDMAVTFNNTAAFHTEWEALMTAYTAAKAAGKATWFEFWIPDLGKGFFFTGEPAKLGFDAVEVNGVAEITAHITPYSVLGWDAEVVPSAAD